jgi:uncharacterized protein YjbI with pentapeptide repeats
VKCLTWLTLDQNISLLPRLEDVSVPSNEPAFVTRAYPNEPYGQPPSFYKVNLSVKDLSHRYLVQADLRDTQLINTNFYMADLSGACLTGANLTNANLKNADLRNAVMTDANMLVADRNGAILIGANLLGVHNLTNDQINSSIFNS